MKAPVRLVLFVAALVAVFAAAFFGARVLTPTTVADAAEVANAPSDHSQSGESHDEESHEDESHEEESMNGAHDEHEAALKPVQGVTSSERGYALRALTAPGEVGVAGTLAFELVDPNGDALIEYATEHERDLHLIVVRSDGAGFRHVHPTLESGGRWSIPWTWELAGAHRVFADFVPADLGEGLTLTSAVQVAGQVGTATPPEAVATTTAGPYEVRLDGEIAAGAASSLEFTVTRDGEPVRLEPYLGANGHLVALRDGDLAYLHVHPEHADADTGDHDSGDSAHQQAETSAVSFMAEVPTAGRYLLYLDFQVDGRVHTAAFAIEAS